jgi:lysophospholipase L1-like esterase
MPLRFAALGDSITRGIGDPVPARGWAAILAESLDGAQFRNFSASGAVTRTVALDQLQPALAWRPDLATILVGVNDTLRGSFNLNQISGWLDYTVGSLTTANAAVITCCLPDPGRMFGLPRSLARPLGRRVLAINSIVHALSKRHNVFHAHIADHPLAYDARMWSIDRLHPNERGHRLLATICFDVLRERGWPVLARPGAEPTAPEYSAAAQVLWMATKGTQWLVRRSTDLLPQLMALAVREWRHSKRGLSAQLDLEMAAEALAAVGLDPDYVASEPVT